MRVAVVSPYDLSRPGGVQHQVLQLASWLRESGHDAWAVGPGDGVDADVRFLGGIVVVPANGARTPIGLHPGTVSRLRMAIEGADVVHVHEPLMPLVGPAALLAADAPVVATFHADPPQRVRRLYSWCGALCRRVIGHASVVTAVSHVAADAVRPFVAPRIIPNAIDVERFDVGVERHPHRVVFVGRDDERKGLSVLLDAWPAVRRAVPDASLVVAGATRPGTVDGVSFLGRFPEEDKAAILAAASVAVTPNLKGESFGLVVAEAMAARCAVVASALPAFVAVLGDTGVLASPGDPRSLADGIVRVLRDDALRNSLAGAAHERVQKFGRDAVLGAYLGAYGEAISGASH